MKMNSMKILPSIPINFKFLKKAELSSRLCSKPTTQGSDIVSFSGNINKLIKTNGTSKSFIETIKEGAENITCRLLSCVKIHREGDLCAGVNLRFRYLSKEEAKGNMSKVLAENPDWSVVIDMMNKADADFKKLPKSIIKHKLFRGMASTSDRVDDGIKVVQNAKIGDTIIPDYGYAYASKSKSIGKDYAFVDRQEWQGPRVLMEIITPKGAQLSRNTRHLKEVVFPRNAKYQIIDKKDENGVTKVVMKYILPKQ